MWIESPISGDKICVRGLSRNGRELAACMDLNELDNFRAGWCHAKSGNWTFYARNNAEEQATLLSLRNIDENHHERF